MSTTSCRRLHAIICAMTFVLLASCAGMSPPEDVAGLMQQGQALYAAKKYDKAIARFQAVVVKDSKHGQARVWLARAYIAKNQWADAVLQARHAHDVTPSGQDVVAVYAEALLGGGSEALDAGKFKDAIAYLGDYISIQPDNARAYLTVARAFLGDKQFAYALAALVKALSIAAGSDRPDVLAALAGGGLLALLQGDARSAIGFFLEYLKIDPTDVRTYIELAKSYWQAGDRASAFSRFQRVLDLNPSNEEVLRFLSGR